MSEQAINLLKGDAVGAETDYRDYLPVNMSAVARPMFGSAGYMLQASGLTQYGTGEGKDRGGVWNERQKLLFRVSGNQLITVDNDGNTEVIGQVDGKDMVSLPYSFNTQAIIASGKFYQYSPTKGLVHIIDTDVSSPIDSVWIDNVYFLTDGEYLYHTDFTNEETINAIKFDSASIQPDPTLGLARTQDNKVAVFGRYSTEYFQTRRADPNVERFGFERVKSRLLSIGIVGTHCKCAMGQRFFILGGRKEENVSIHAIGVGQTEKVANREVDKVIGQYTEDELSTSKLEMLIEDAYSYLIVHLPNETLMLNLTIAESAGLDSAWTILRTGVENKFKAPARDYRAKHGVFDPRRGQWVYGDKEDATLGILDNTASTQYDELTEWMLNTPFIWLDNLSIDKLEIETVAGHTTEPDAQVFFSRTNDGMHHSKEYVMQYGKPSEFTKRFVRYRLGYVNNWVGIRLRGASRSRMAFSRAFIEAS